MATSRFERYLLPIYIVVEACILAAVKITEQTAQMGVVRTIRYLAIIINTIVTLYFFFAHGRKAFAGGSSAEERANTLDGRASGRAGRHENIAEERGRHENIAEERGRHENLVCLALVINLIADFFLTLLGGDFYGTIGVCFFCILESVYAVYLKSPVPSIIARAALFVALGVAAFLTHHLTVTTVVAVLNISILTVNLIDAWSAKRFDAGLLFKLGITLFFIGDLCVGVKAVTGGNIREAASFLVWIFYIPTQVLLTLHYARKVETI